VWLPQTGGTVRREKPRPPDNSAGEAVQPAIAPIIIVNEKAGIGPEMAIPL
jgi:hypothetical protein